MPKRRRRPLWIRGRDLLLAPLFAVLHFCGFLAYQLRSGRGFRTLRRALRLLFLPLWYLLGVVHHVGAAVGQFVFDWGRTRAYMALLYGMPALMVGIGMLFVLVTGLWQAKAELVTDYRRAAAKAVEAEDLDRAELFVRKLAYLDHQEPALQYALGLLAVEKDKPARGHLIMQRLAPRDEPGYVPAHLWLARSYLEQAATSAEHRQLVQQHLEHAVAEEPDQIEANLLLGQLSLAGKDAEKAEEHLRRAVQKRPELGTAVGRLWYQQGHAERAREYIQLAQVSLVRAVEREPDNLAIRSQLADAHSMLGQFAEAEKLLVEGQSLATTDDAQQKLKNSLGGLYAAWSDAMRRSGVENLPASMKLLERAVRLAPSHPAVLLVLRECSSLRGDDAAQFDALLEQMLTTGEAPALVHLIIGTKAVENNQLEKAMLHLEQAYNLEPTSGVILGNLAWTLAIAEPPQYERALELVNAAIEKLSHNAELYETRGYVLVKLDRHREALPDLERALTEIKQRPRIHELLAEAYERLGEPALAARHRKEASKAVTPDG